MSISLKQKIFVNLVLSHGGIVTLYSLNTASFNKEKVQNIIDLLAPCLEAHITDTHIVKGFKLYSF